MTSTLTDSRSLLGKTRSPVPTPPDTAARPIPVDRHSTVSPPPSQPGPRRITRSVRSLIALSALILAIAPIPALTACAGGSRDALPRSPVAEPLPGNVPIRATLRDLGPAVRYAASRNEMAVLDTSRPEPGIRRFDLITLRDEPATLTVRLPDDVISDDNAQIPPASGIAPSGRAGRNTPFLPSRGDIPTNVDRTTPLDMTASLTIGLDADPRRHHDFIRDLTARLRALEKGGGTAPIPDQR